MIDVQMAFRAGAAAGDDFRTVLGMRPDFTAIGPSFEQNRAMLAGKADFLLLARRSISESNRLT